MKNLTAVDGHARMKMESGVQWGVRCTVCATDGDGGGESMEMRGRKE